MKSLQNRLKAAKENRGGFTLVEIVVVLVIIAILATLMLGAYNGYIDKAKEKTLTADTRSLYLAAQTVASEKYANGTSLISGGTTAAGTLTGSTSGSTDEIIKLADLTSKNYTYEVTIDSTGKVTKAKLTDSTLGKVCEIDAATGKATIS